MNKNTWIAIAVAIFVVGFFLFGGTIVNLFNPSDSQNTTQTMNDTTNTADINQPPAGLIVQDKTVGTGAEATAGTLVTVNYVGSFTDGTKFDASADHGKPFQFVLGAGQVIPGWDQGVAGMKVGGSRILVVPPSLGYGASGSGPIPGNSTLIFQIELLAVSPVSPVSTQ